MEILLKNRQFGQNSTIWSKIDNLVKNRNFTQKSTIWSNIQILKSKFFVKNRSLAKIVQLIFQN